MPTLAERVDPRSSQFTTSNLASGAYPRRSARLVTRRTLLLDLNCVGRQGPRELLGVVLPPRLDHDDGFLLEVESDAGLRPGPLDGGALDPPSRHRSQELARLRRQPGDAPDEDPVVGDADDHRGAGVR